MQHSETQTFHSSSHSYSFPPTPLFLFVIFSPITQSVIDTQSHKCTMHNIGISAGIAISNAFVVSFLLTFSMKGSCCFKEGEYLKMEIFSDLFSILTL